MQFPLEKTVLIETVLSRDSLYCIALPQLAKIPHEVQDPYYYRWISWFQDSLFDRLHQSFYINVIWVVEFSAQEIFLSQRKVLIFCKMMQGKNINLWAIFKKIQLFQSSGSIQETNFGPESWKLHNQIVIQQSMSFRLISYVCHYNVVSLF